MSFDPEASQISWEVDFSSSSGTPTRPAAALGAFSERFKVEGLLGAGGMGSVYLAEDLSMGRRVAIKVLNGQISNRQRQRFVAEGQVTARLRHPGVVRIFGAGRAGDHDYLVYEWIQGGRALDDAFAGASLEKRLELVIQLCDAVGAAHRAGIVHRDLKCENVLVDEDGKVHVLDFGIALAPEVDRVTLSGEYVGTPLYMSPERFGARTPPDPTLDVWSIGVILYLALTDEFPFQGETLLQIVDAVCNPIAEVSSASQASPAVMAVCRGCLRRLPRERYQEADAISDALRRALRGEPPGGSRRGAWAGLAGVLALLLVFGVTALVSSVVWSPVDVEALIRDRPTGEWTQIWKSDHFVTPEQREELALAILASDLPLRDRIEFGVLAAEAKGVSYRSHLALARVYTSAGEPLLGVSSILKARSAEAPEQALREALLALSASDPELRGVHQLRRSRSWPLRAWGPDLVRRLLEDRPQRAEAVLAVIEVDLPKVEAVGLRARVGQALGRDPRPDLEAACTANPGQIELELALAHLEAGDRESAVEVLERLPPTRRMGELEQLRSFLERPNRQAPIRWREAFGIAVESEIRVDLALSRRQGALPERKRRSRVLGRAEELLALGIRQDLATLAMDWGQERDSGRPYSGGLSECGLELQAEVFLGGGRAAALELRGLSPAVVGEVLLARGDRQAAFEVLMPMTRRERLPRLRLTRACLVAAREAAPERVPALEQLVSSLSGELREKGEPLLAEYLKARRRGYRSYEEEIAALERVFAVDPANPRALLYFAEAISASGRSEGESMFDRLGSVRPALMTKLHGVLLNNDRRLPPTIQNAAAVRRLRTLELGLRPGQSFAALVSTFDQDLRREPASQWVRTQRALAAIRSKRYRRAEADLRLVLEEEPTCAQAHFYLALLAGARREPERVLAHFRDAVRHGYSRSSAWTADRYPELTPYWERPGFEILSR